MPIKHLKTKKILIAKTAGLAGTEFKNRTFAGADFRKTNLEGAKFENCSFKGARFWGTKLTRASFEGCDLRGATFKEATLDATSFHRCDARDAKLRNCTISSVEFGETLLSNAEIVCDVIKRLSLRWCLASNIVVGGSSIERCAFDHTLLQDATFTGDYEFGSLTVSNTTFKGCDLSGSKFAECRLDSCYIEKCKGAGIEFSDDGIPGIRNLFVAHSNLRDTDFNMRTLKGGGFFECDLGGSSFLGTKLLDVGFHQTNLSVCDFYGVDSVTSLDLVVDDSATYTLVGWDRGGKAHVTVCKKRYSVTRDASRVDNDWPDTGEYPDDEEQRAQEMLAMKKAAKAVLEEIGETVEASMDFETFVQRNTA